MISASNHFPLHFSYFSHRAFVLGPKFITIDIKIRINFELCDFLLHCAR